MIVPAPDGIEPGVVFSGVETNGAKFQQFV
jgi:hypothetical protein